MSRDITYLRMPYHQQDADIGCGLACAQMLLHSLVVGTSIKPQDEIETEVDTDPIYTYEPDIEWATAPDTLCYALNQMKDPAFAGTFHIPYCATESAATRQIIWNIENHNIAAIALVYGFQHWLIVRGYTATATPTSATDTSYTPISFDLYDPWPAVPSSNEPLNHIDFTDGCGSGGQRGAPLNNLSYAAWQTTGGPNGTGYMTGIPTSVESTWKGQYVVICDPPADQGQSDAQADQPNDVQPVERGNEVISPQDAIDRAVAGLHDFGLADREDWKPIVEKTIPDKPYLIGHLDAPGAAYYIVPFKAQSLIQAAVRVDAYTGKYLQAIAVPNPQFNIINIGQNSEILSDLVGQKITFGKAQLVVRREDIDASLPLVWKPCVESFSPFVPFHQITLPGPNLDGVYRIFVRTLDGQKFVKLNNRVGGA